MKESITFPSVIPAGGKKGNRRYMRFFLICFYENCHDFLFLLFLVLFKALLSVFFLRYCQAYIYMRLHQLLLPYTGDSFNLNFTKEDRQRRWLTCTSRIASAVRSAVNHD